MTQQLELPATRTRAVTMSYREFLRRDHENEHVEWVGGKVIPMAPVSDEHQDVAGFLLAVLRLFVEHHELGVVRHDPFQMKTGPDLPGRAPDILFVANRNRSRLKKNYLDGPADLVIEIISGGSRGTDRGDKFFEYEKGGVREYWLIDTIRTQAEFYRLGRDRRYHLVSVGNDRIYRSVVLKGVWIDVAWLWKLPAGASVLKKWKVM